MRKKANIYPWIILGYCLFFAIIRLIQADNLSHDEAEQIMTASNYALGYSKQPPLYSWILKSFSYIFGLNLYTLTLVKYGISFLCFWSFYYLAKEFFEDRLAFLATSSLIFFISYSYDFNRDLTHTILVTCLSISSYLIYIKLLQSGKLKYYLLLGLVIGLGFLAKYNFIFITLIIILSSLSTKTGRKIFLNIKTLYSMVISLLVAGPHFAWLIDMKMNAINYAIGRASPGDGHILSPLKSLAFSYYEILLVLSILFLLWHKIASKNNGLSKSSRALKYSTVYALAIPTIFIVFLGFGSFYAKWLSSISFIFVLFFFDRYKLEIKQAFKKREKIHYILVSLVIIIIASIDLISYFKPDLIGKPKNILYPYQRISEKLLYELKVRNIDSKNAVIVTSRRPLLLGNLRNRLPAELEITRLKNLKASNKTKILIWKTKVKRQDIPKAFLKAFPDLHQQEHIYAGLINSEKHTYYLGWAITYVPQHKPR